MKTAARRPQWTRFIAVDVVIEGFTFGSDGPAVRAALLRAAPKAYARPIRLGSIWSRLTEETRAALAAAWEREKHGATLRKEAS